MSDTLFERKNFLELLTGIAQLTWFNRLEAAHDVLHWPLLIGEALTGYLVLLFGT